MKTKKRKRLSVLDQLSLEAKKYKDNPFYVDKHSGEVIPVEPEFMEADKRRGTQHRFKSFRSISGRIEKAP